MGFISSFSAPFLVSVALWPFASFLLTVPVLAMLYHRDNRLGFGAALSAYGTVLYAIGLLCFTLYPMPAEPAAYCATHHLTPQLDPVQFVADIRSDGVTAILQIVMNVVFFMPLGFIVRRVFRRHLPTALIGGFLASLMVETLQLTGLLGIFPCSYRLFDVDDLIWNTSGALIGYALALLFDRIFPQRQADTATVTQPGFVRRFIAFLIDYGLAMLCSLPIVIGGDALYTMATGERMGRIMLAGGALGSVGYAQLVMLAMLAVFELIIPWRRQGSTLGGSYTHMTCETKTRSGWRRAAFYAARFAVICCVVFGGDVRYSGLVVIAVLVFWFIRHRMPYDLI
ncbi:VanZ family protein [Bifidobacterium leontopitheci]|uniref:VanZ family protein n=1 Tax=Bifidobacterium leontopitheci TaxID=2650774 RepID=A0A6I1GH73_9BIFI|nr:VanZ family protein [Bifidobacterium leontopitheci]KAB7790975.1 vanZ family protein [Bifidobacterium leontopitheci]